MSTKDLRLNKTITQYNLTFWLALLHLGFFFLTFLFFNFSFSFLSEIRSVWRQRYIN